VTCSVITFRGWICGRLALGRDGDGRPVCGQHAPESWRAYLDAVSTLAAYARLHRLLGHPWPRAECSTCDGIERRRRELAAACPA
jgi:hypothetical protein